MNAIPGKQVTKQVRRRLTGRKKQTPNKGKNMKTPISKFTLRTITTSIAIALTAAALSAGVQAKSISGQSVKIFEADFESRKVVQVEAGVFHFVPGQVAPIHTHTAPAVGYVVKGEIIYQVEGEKQLLLREGDAFYEPVGPRILRFDNASATEAAIFVDFNLEQEGEPFIVFEKPPTENIDRRTLPTVKLSGKPVDKVNIFKRDLAPNEIVKINNDEPTLGIVAQGVVIIHEPGKSALRIVAGASFALPDANSGASITNASSEAPAKVITFRVL